MTAIRYFRFMDLFLTICDYVAYLTNILGIPLALIETFRPALADQIEEWIDSAEDSFRAFGDRWTGNNFFEILLSLAIPITIAIIVIGLSWWSPVLSIIYVPV